MTGPGGLLTSLAMLAGLLRGLAAAPAGGAALTALAAAVLAGAVLAAVLALTASVAGASRSPAAAPVVGRVAALRHRSWRAASGRQRDPDAPGRARPRAPSAARAAACPR